MVGYDIEIIKKVFNHYYYGQWTFVLKPSKGDTLWRERFICVLAGILEYSGWLAYDTTTFGVELEGKGPPPLPLSMMGSWAFPFFDVINVMKNNGK